MIDVVLKGRKMREARMLRPLLAAVVLLTIVAPIAVAGAQSQPTAQRSASKKALKLLKGLKKETAAIATEIVALREKIGVLEAPKQAPASVPTGPAAGDLTGSYPNPKVRANSITSANIVDQTVTSADIAPNTIESFNIADATIGSADFAANTIGQADLGGGSVGARQLGSVRVVPSGPNQVGGNASGGLDISCGVNERLLSGGAEWQDAIPGVFIIRSRPNPDNSNQWQVIGRNNSGTFDNLRAYALCLG